MRTAAQVLKEIENELPGFHSNKYAILKQWAEEIIDQCAIKANAHMTGGGMGWPEQCSVNRASITKIKKEL